MSHLKYYYGIYKGKNKHLYTEVLMHSHQLFLYMYNIATAHTGTHMTGSFICGYHEYKKCRTQRLVKSCDSKWRELTGMTERILPVINESV